MLILCILCDTMCLAERKKKRFVIHSLFVKVYFYEQIVESTISSNKGNKRKWGEIPRLASNRDAFRTTRRETSYRLDVKISLGQKHTSMRKGKQAKRRFLLQRQETRSAALFG